MGEREVEEMVYNKNKNKNIYLKQKYNGGKGKGLSRVSIPMCTQQKRFEGHFLPFFPDAVPYGVVAFFFWVTSLLDITP